MTSAVLARLAKLMRLVRLITDGIPSSINVKSVRYTPVKIKFTPIPRKVLVEPTEERNTRGIGEVQRFSVFSKIPRAAHELPHLFQNSHRPGVNLIPCSTQPMDWSSSERRNDRG